MNEQQFKKLLIDMVSIGDYACKDELMSLLKIINVKCERTAGFAYSGVWNQRKEYVYIEIVDKLIIYYRNIIKYSN